MPEYVDDLKIDRYKLEEETEQQPFRYDKWNKIYAQARAFRDKIRRKRDVIRASVAENFKKNRSSLSKVTVLDITNHVDLHEDVNTIENELIEAELEVNILEGAVEAFKQRRWSLGDLVKLYLGKYFSDVPLPSITDEQEERINQQKEMETGFGNKMRNIRDASE